MYVAIVIVNALTAFFLVQSALMKFRHDERVHKQIVLAAGVPESWVPWLGSAEVAGGVGLLAGLAYRPLGVAAAIGLVLYFVGAVAAHLRLGDRYILPALLLLVMSGAALGLQAANL